MLTPAPITASFTRAPAPIFAPLHKMERATVAPASILARGPLHDGAITLALESTRQSRPSSNPSMRMEPSLGLSFTRPSSASRWTRRDSEGVPTAHQYASLVD